MSDQRRAPPGWALTETDIAKSNSLADLAARIKAEHEAAAAAVANK